jgi:septal ring factor EnvC (AmiA/AmiB activator)
MQVRYVDEYGNGLFWGETKQPIAPNVGDTVILEEEEYRVKSRTFLPEEEVVVIELTQNQVRSKAPDEVGDRLKEMQRAIVEVNKRQDSQEKKSRLLREQLVSVRTHLRTRQNDTR